MRRSTFSKIFVLQFSNGDPQVRIAGEREGSLYEQLSLKYMKITHNMRKRQQEVAKHEALAHADVRRSVRIKTENSEMLPMLCCCISQLDVFHERLAIFPFLCQKLDETLTH